MKEEDKRVVPQIQQEVSLEAPQRPVVIPTDFVSSLKKGVTEPSVRNLIRLRAGGVAVTITDFKHGQNGQNIKVLGDGVTEINTNANIIRSEDGVLAANKVYSFVKYDGVWYEEGATGNGGGGGSQGPQGEKGDKGDKGDPGPEGPAGFMPTEILTGETFTIPARRQGLFADPIDIAVGGTLDVIGSLILVD